VTSLALTAATICTGPLAAAATVPSSQPSWCGWRPAHDSWASGWLDSWVPIYDGQGTECNTIAYAGLTDNVDVMCEDAQWYHIFDYANGLYGWVSRSEFADLPGSIGNC